jgi:hypothetical protein
MTNENQEVILPDSKIIIEFVLDKNNEDVDDELIEKIEHLINSKLNNSTTFHLGYINSSNAETYFLNYDKYPELSIKKILIFHSTFSVEDATEILGILLNDYADDPRIRNVRNQEKKIIDGGNDEFYTYVAYS